MEIYQKKMLFFYHFIKNRKIIKKITKKKAMKK